MGRRDRPPWGFLPPRPRAWARTTLPLGPCGLRLSVGQAGGGSDQDTGGNGSALMGNQIGGPQRQPPTKPTWLGRAFPFQDTCSEELPSCPVVRPHSCHCQGHEFSP